MMKLASLIGLVMFLVAACDTPPPSPTPTRELSAPTLAPSQEILPVAPRGEPTQRLNAGQNDPTAAALASGAELPPLAVGTVLPGDTHQVVQVTVADGVLNGDLYTNPLGNRVPGVLLLAPDRTAWLDLPLRLQAEGFTVLSVDLLEGDNSSTYYGTLLQTLIQVGTVDPGRIGVIGAERGADAALAGCASDSLCDALVLFTPIDRAGDLNAIARYNPRPMYIAAASEDADFAVANALASGTTGEVELASVQGAARGARLLQAQPSLSDDVLRWLDDQLGAGISAEG
jgi:energy-converting hydrogenase Eha subunit C